MSGLHFLATEIADAQTLDDAVLAVPAGYGIRVDHSFRYPVAAVGGDAHADPIAGRCAEHPIVNMVERRRCRGGGGGGAARLDDGRAALLHRRYEGVLEPGRIDCGERRL